MSETCKGQFADSNISYDKEQNFFDMQKECLENRHLRLNDKKWSTPNVETSEFLKS